jgi:hypothetical protein
MTSNVDSYYLVSFDTNLCFLWGLKISNINSNSPPSIALGMPTTTGFNAASINEPGRALGMPTTTGFNAASINEPGRVRSKTNSIHNTIIINGTSESDIIALFDANDYNIFNLVGRQSIGFTASYTCDGLFNYVVSQTNVLDNSIVLASSFIYTISSFRNMTLIYNSEKQSDHVLQSNDIGALSIVKYVEWSNVIKLPYVLSSYFEKIIYAKYLYMPVLIMPIDCKIYSDNNQVRYIVFNGTDSYVLLAWIGSTNQWIILNGYGIILSFRQ